MTAFPRCSECNGQRVPMNYVGDVVGAMCMCPVSKSTLYGPWNSFDMGNWSEFTKMLVAERDRLRAEVEALKVGDALHKVCVQQRDQAWREVESLRAKAAAFDEWLAKTEWVQETAEAGELGTHRADVMRKRIEALRSLVEDLAMHDSYSTEYDGRMIVLCPACGGQDGTHTTGCVFVRAKAHIDAARAAQGGEHG